MAHQLNALISAPFTLNQSSVTVGSVQAGLFTTQNSAGIYCVGSPVPVNYHLSNLFSAGTAFASTRLTEGFGSAFTPRGPGDDTGTRFIIRYSGFPAESIRLRSNLRGRLRRASSYRWWRLRA